MTNQTIMQESFAAGEISPLTYGRLSADGYQSGCKSLLNMVPDSRGPVVSRAGARHIDLFDGQDGRVQSLSIDRNLLYIALFTDQKLTITNVFGANPATNYVTNGRFTSGDTGWETRTQGQGSSVAFSSGLSTLTQGGTTNDYARIYQEVTVPAPGDYDVVVTTHGNDFYSVKVGVAEDDATYGATINDAIETVISVTVPGTTFWVTVEVNWAITPAPDTFIKVASVAVTDDSGAYPEFATPYLDGEYRDIQFAAVPDGDEMYVLHPKYAPRKLAYNRATDSYSFSTVTFTDPPSTWVTGNYPSTGTLFEGRLWLGSTPNEGQTVWGSKSGFHEIFTVGTGLDDESVTVTLARYGRIEWIEGFKNLLVGTVNGEHIITSEGGVITPDDHNVDQQSAYGSANIKAVMVGDQAFYVSSDGQRLRAMQYEWSKDNYLSTDLTYFSQHITQSGIKEIAWQQNPFNTFWCLLENGTIAALSYDRSNNIYGWSRHSVAGEDDHGDKVISITSGSIQGTDLAIGLVKRNGTQLAVESNQIDKNFYMDSWKDYDFNGTPSDTVTELDHLEGREVQVLVGRNTGDELAVHPNKTVSGGSITLDYEVTEAIVGLGYRKEIQLLPTEKGARLGSSAPYWKNFHAVHAHLLASANPLVNGKRAPSRTPSTPMGSPEPVRTGKSYINLTEWQNETDITLCQDLPLQFTLAAVSGEINQEKL